jgi:hypothetical protein
MRACACPIKRKQFSVEWSGRDADESERSLELFEQTLAIFEERLHYLEHKNGVSAKILASAWPADDTVRNMTSLQEYQHLAAQEAELAKAAITNESRAQHYAMTAYYARLAEAKEKLAMKTEVMATDATSNA